MLYYMDSFIFVLDEVTTNQPFYLIIHSEQ